MADAQIPSEFDDLFEKPILYALATIMPDGQPQVTPVWGDRVGDTVRVNTAVDRQKDKNLRRQPKTTVMLIDPENPFRWIEVRGEARPVLDGADAHIDALAKKYIGADVYPNHTDAETRVIFEITPTRVTHS